MEQTTTYRDFDLVASKYLSGEASKDEKSWLLSAIQDNTDLRTAFHAMQSSYSLANTQTANFDSNAAFASFKEASGIGTKKAKTRSMRTLSQWVAAAAVLVFISGTAWHFMQKEPMQELHSQLVLVEKTTPDGSVITLNEFSQISYPKQFEETRAITLKGQAFFEVAPDAAHPFSVSVGNVTVTVLGTGFDISSYPYSDSISVVVSHGKVMVSTQTDTVYLEKGQRADYSKSTEELSQSANEDRNYLSWKTKKLEFNGTPLKQVCADLQRFYGKSIVLENDSIADCKLTATYDDYPLDLTLEMLEVAFNIEIEKRDSSFIISGDKCNF